MDWVRAAKCTAQNAYFSGEVTTLGKAAPSSTLLLLLVLVLILILILIL